MRTVLAILALTVGTVNCFNFPYTEEVQTKRGKVIGKQVSAQEFGTVDFFEGIRFGKAGRFEKPKAVEPWTDVYNATRFRFACAQSSIPITEETKLGPVNGIQTGQSSEDCLFLNLWRTANYTGKKRPVMVFFYGGAFELGTVFEIYYDGRYLSSIGDVIVVTANYRLGAFGFMYGGGKEYDGNMGLYDMKLALEWIQENVEAFGGDKDQVTIFGESAGSMSTGALILSPLTKGLFHRAIMQSGSPNSFFASADIEKSKFKTQLIAEQMECPDKSPLGTIHCLKNKTAEEVIKGDRDGMPIDNRFSITYGTEFLPKSPVEALSTGDFNKIDLIFGANDDEGSLFVEKFHPIMDPKNDGHTVTKDTAEKLIYFMCSLSKEKYCKEVQEFYGTFMNASDHDQMRHIIAESFGDYHITCPTIQFGKLIQKWSVGKNVYSYRLMRKPEILRTQKKGGCSGWTGVCHALDLLYVFGIPIITRGFLSSEIEYQFSVDINKAWTNFAKTGHPGKMGHLEWEPAISYLHHDNDSKGPHSHFTNVLMLDPTHYRMDHFYKKTCDTFWSNKLGIH